MADTPVAVHCLTSSDNAAQCPDCRRYMSNVSEQQQTMFPDATTCNYTQDISSAWYGRYSRRTTLSNIFRQCSSTLCSRQRDTTQKLVSVCGIIQYRSVHCTVCTKQKQLRDQCYSEYETVLLADAFNYNL